MKKIDLMIFDLDGTLVDSGDDIASAVNYTLQKMSLPVLEREIVLGYVGDGVRELIERSIGDDNRDKAKEAYEMLISYYRIHCLDTTSVYPGVTDVLYHFRETKKVIVTNKIEDLSRIIASALEIDGYFEEIIGRDTGPYKKPDPALMNLLTEKFSADVKKTVVVGDGWNDINLAKNSGALSCALLNGLGKRDSLLELNPDYACENITELKDLFF
ncbi:MAG: HAD-IA family hydrolase [Deltaproteobacteria bacterium]|nr:HAD-IA family hydrolase [Deltaproteobacteria bacterium]